jgi:hypothetical protein
MFRHQHKKRETDMDEQGPLGELAKALVAFQSECPRLSFDKTVKTGRYSFDYVTLAKIVNETKPLLAKHGLTISQNPVPCADDKKVAIKTIILHTSGQLMSSTFEMIIPTKGGAPTPQDYGSGISYAKRYAYASALSLVTEEDIDGLPPQEIYQGTKEDIAWLKETCAKLGVVDTAIQKAIHGKMLETTNTKDAKLIAKLID